MSEELPTELNLHTDAAYFRKAVRHSAAQNGFCVRLIEKDYFCTGGKSFQSLE